MIQVRIVSRSYSCDIGSKSALIQGQAVFAIPCAWVGRTQHGCQLSYGWVSICKLTFASTNSFLKNCHGHLMQNIFTYLHLASSAACWLHIRGPSSKIIHSFTYNCLAKSDVSFSPHLAIISRPLFKFIQMGHYMQPSRASIFISSW